MTGTSWRSLALWCGLALYILSFGLEAVDDDGAPMRGWLCAVSAFGLPWWALMPTNHILEGAPMVWSAALISGWINPVFLISLVQILRDRHRSAGTLRIAVLVMVCSCWVVFSHFDLQPREGFVMWLVGMVLVLSSIQVPTR